MPTRGLAVALAAALSAIPAFAQDAEKPVEAGSTSALFAVVGLAMDDELNIRATATATSVVIARVPNGTALKNRGCMTVNKYVWCKVEYPDDATVVGWSPARYLIELPGSGTAEDLPAMATGVADAASAGEDAAEKKAVAEATEGIMGSKVFAPLGDRSEADDRKTTAVAAVQAVAEGGETDGDPVAAPPGTIQLPVTLGEELVEIEPNAAASILPQSPETPVAVAKSEAAPKEGTAAPGGPDAAPAVDEGGAAAAGSALNAAPTPEAVKAPAPPPPAAAGDDADSRTMEAEAPKPAPAGPEPASGDGETAKAAAESGAPATSASQGATEPQASVAPADPGLAASAEAKPVSADAAEVADVSPKAEDLASTEGGGAAASEGDASDEIEAAYADEEADPADGKSGLELLRARFGKLEKIEEPGSGDGASAAVEAAKPASDASGNTDLASSEGDDGSVAAAEAAKPPTDATEVAIDVRDHDGVKTASDGFDATGEVSCSRYFGQPMVLCHAGVLRGEKGEALVTVTWPDGGERVIRFRAGQVEGTDASDAVTVVREAELNLIRVGKGERFEISDSFAFGG